MGDDKAERDRIDRERRAIFDQITGQARMLSNDDAAELNRELKMIVDKLVARATRKS